MRAAYHAESAIVAEAQLEVLAKELERTRWCAAGMIEASKQFRRGQRPPAPAGAARRAR